MKRPGVSSRSFLFSRQLSYFVLASVLVGLAALALSCSRQGSGPKDTGSKLSTIKVEVRDGGPVVVTTGTAEFQILPAGYLQATLLKDGKRFSLDEPEPGSAEAELYQRFLVPREWV